MSNTVRIRTTPNGSDKFLKLKLDQDFDFIEILSLKISQEDVYRKFCSDYGVVVGRVSVNNGFGVPNAKVSVFIPIDDVDKLNPEILGLYPYEVVTDKNSEGIRYNLLPKDGETQDSCFTPIGTFSAKREILDNDILLDVYCKYYKFTSTTNHAGDFMIFGVPLGTYTVHVDADISDIGIITQKPYDLISQGTPEKLFDSPTKFKGNKNLDKLIQIKTLNSGVNIQPFWGDVENCEVGINRLDFDLNYTVRPAAIFVGSIFGDSDKNSVNKYCRPRRKLGEICEQVTAAGTIQMIRKTVNNQTEEFSVDGGRVIDDDGSWAYQIPMNLDYMVTDENGDLILSQDTNKGIPTRARVRFKIGMDETGDEGRLRYRAKYLVPHNPTNPSEIDYTFDINTKDSSFKDIFWNKIYSVSNFIPRFQRNNIFDHLVTPSKNIFATGIKDVDACVGDKTPFPYNRVTSFINPIFFIICLIIKIITFLIYIMNAFIIPIINIVIDIIRTVIYFIIDTINGIINTVNNILDWLPGDWGHINTIDKPTLNNIGCVFVNCPVDAGSSFAPGCSKGGLDGGKAYSSTNPKPTYYDGDTSGHSGFLNSGLDNCIAFEMARALDLFRFDFYNDWINGTLFDYLLKYKKRRKGREIFCEYDCGDFGIAAGGSDGNHNGVPDNDCLDSVLLDTTFSDENDFHLVDVREGLIKKIGKEFYYAATTHNNAYKLFATDVIELGSVFDCDWQGFPKIEQYLIPTTYKVPPDIQEVNDAGQLETCGMVDIGGTTSGLFFSIDCLGVHSNLAQCLNIRHLSEFGVDISQSIQDPVYIAADCIIGVNEINDDKGKFTRDVFTILNTGKTNSSFAFQSPLNTDFNLGDVGNYDFSSYGNNGKQYIDFRGIVSNQYYAQSKHSYFFYFGLLPGKTSLDKMNQRFFTTCVKNTRDDIIIQASSTNTTIVGGLNGTITFTFIGGVGPFTYNVIGINGTSYQFPILGNATTSGTVTLTGLAAGTYQINGFDSLGTPVSTTVSVSGPAILHCGVFVTRSVTSTTVNDGQITITEASGGTPLYTYDVKNSLGSFITSGFINSSPLVINGLGVDLIGYTVTIKDSSVPQEVCVTTGLTINGPVTLTITTSSTNVLCTGGSNGKITITVGGGKAPYSIFTSGPGYSNTGSSGLTALKAGSYTTTVTDSLGNSATSYPIVNTTWGPMTLLIGDTVDLLKQCDTSTTVVTVKADPSLSSGISIGQSVPLKYSVDGGVWQSAPNFTFNNNTTPISFNVSQPIFSKIDLKYNNPAGCESNTLSISKTKLVLPTAKLKVVTSGPTNKQCTVGSIDLNINITGGFTPYTITYSAGTGAPNSTSSAGPIVNLTGINTAGSSNTQVFVEVKDNVGCTTMLAPTFIITPSLPLNATFNQVGLTITSVPTGGLGGYTYLWSNGSTNSTITASSYGQSFNVVVTDSGGCTITRYVTS